MKAKIAAPGFILMNEMEKDFRGTVRRIAEMGYDGLELMGFYEQDAKATMEVLKEFHLEPFGCFVLAPVLLGEMPASTRPVGSAMENIQGNCLEERLDYIRSIGCTYMTVATNETLQEAEAVRYCRELAGPALGHGLKLQFHNHNWEYERVTDGNEISCRMDRMLQEIPETVLFEPDLGWMSIAGIDPATELERYGSRIEVVHMKDFYRESADHFSFLPTGYGQMNWPKLLQICEERIHPSWYVMDHDKSYRLGIFEELELSLQYVRKLLELYK